MIAVIRWLSSNRERLLEGLPFVFYAIVTGSLCLYFLTSTWDSPGADGSLYREAAAAWLSGVDPWSVGPSAAHFSGSPSTILVFVPTALLPDAVWRPASFLLDIVLAILVLRRLRLGLWWLAYPPISIAIFLGQPGIVVLALLVLGGAWLAPSIKMYGLLPLVVGRRWGAVLAALLFLACLVLVAPGLWLEWVRRLPELTGRLYAELHDSPDVLLSVTGAAALVVIWRLRPRVAPWLSIAALWPTWEYHNAIYSLPTLNPILLLGQTLVEGRVVVIAYAGWLLLRLAIGIRRRNDPRRFVRLGMRRALRISLRSPSVE